MFVLQIAFVVCAALVAYHYFVYPALVIGLARIRKSIDLTPWRDGEMLPSLTVVIAAYDEQHVIAAKLENTLGLDYPADRLRVVVAAHGSSDATVAIAKGFEGRGVLVLHEPERRGKTSALNVALDSVTSEIVVFSDANNMFDKDALRQLARHFADPKLGGVCGRKQIRENSDRESARGDGLYWRYEAAIKTAESVLGSVTTADGEIFAIRRSLFRPMDESLINDDAALTLLLVSSGYRVRYEPEARSYEDASIVIEDDFNVKVRMVSGGFQTIEHFRSLLIPPRSAFAWAFLSHKLLRWLVPELLVVMFLSSVILAGQPLFGVALALQLCFYGLAWIGWRFRARRKLPLVIYVPFYFCAMNLAALFGLYRHLSRTTQWKKARR